MGGAARQSQAERFLNAFKDRYDEKTALPEGPWFIVAQGIGMSDDGEIRHFVSIKCGDQVLDDVDTGLISIDVNSPYPGGAQDVLDHVLNVLPEMDEETAKRRIVESGMFDEGDFTKGDSKDGETL